MKKGENDALCVESMLDAIAKIARHQQAHSASETIESAIMYEMITIGEAANKLSDRVQAENEHIPWAQIIALRNVLIHNYLGVDTDELWMIVRGELPTLENHLSIILKRIT